MRGLARCYRCQQLKVCTDIKRPRDYTQPTYDYDPLPRMVWICKDCKKEIRNNG